MDINIELAKEIMIKINSNETKLIVMAVCVEHSMFFMYILFHLHYNIKDR